MALPDWLSALRRERQLSVGLPEALEVRLRAYVDRLNHGDRDVALDPLDPDSDTDLAMALICAAEGEIEADEQAHGLVGSSMSGALRSAEVADEERRRRTLGW